MPSTALKPTAPKRTLFDVEQSLLALLDFEGEEQDEQFQEVIRSGLDRAVDKRQQVGEFALYIKNRKLAYKSEIKRLQAGLKGLEGAEERISNNAVYVILSLGHDGKGELRKLKGHTLTLSAAKNPKSVDITNEDAIPDRFKTFATTFPMDAWRELVGLVKTGTLALIASPASCGLLQHAVEKATESGELSISKKAIGEALDAGEDVPGATWKPNSYRLAVR